MRDEVDVVLQGLNLRGRCYGYLNVPIEDPSWPGKYGNLSSL